jgi:Family of unknown function (DUF6210)
MNQLTVVLYGLKVDCGIIIPCPSGIVYRNQTSGLRCRQDSLEGTFVPMDWPSASDAMEEILHSDPTLSVGDADRIDVALDDGFPRYKAKVNRDKLASSHEAWVWLRIVGDFPYVEGLQVSEAVLTWCNSD